MTLRRDWMRRLLWIYCFLAFTIKSLSAQTIPPDFRNWFFQQVTGKPFGQQTLLELAPQLPCVGSALTPPNAVGERTKIFDPTTGAWTRVGFGEGHWVWIAQAPAPAPVFSAADLALCGQPSNNPQPPAPPVSVINLDPIVARLDAITAQNERIFSNLSTQIGEVRLQVQAHDQKPNPVLEFLRDPKTISAILGAVGSCAATQCWK